MFESVFNAQNELQDSGYETSEIAATCSESGQTSSAVRVYSSDQDILGAYYTYIHPYFPVLPPPEPHQIVDNPEVGIRRAPDAFFSSRKVPDFEPSSPLSLAISATLALIPHPDDLDPFGTDSVHLRREQAQAFAHSAYESIEIESELVESTTQPAEALSSESHVVDRLPFHSQNPLENESIIALLLLSSYEYAQRGNIAKMRNRAGQALNSALNLGLHTRNDENSPYAEADKRVWWMTYITVCQGSILSNSPSPVLLYDPRFTTPSPTFSADPEAWPLFLQAQQVIVSATQFVIDLDVTMKSHSTTSAIWQRMLELEALIEPLVLKADTWALESSPPVSLDSTELKVSQALKGIARIKLNSARIKLHRYCAFQDIPVFSKKHCDLKSAAEPTITGESPSAPVCACSSTFHQIHSAVDLFNSPTSVSSPPTNVSCGLLPFSSHFSAKVCLRSSLNIARSFQSLPYPQPRRTNEVVDYFSIMKDNSKVPRTIPVFACCAMQSSYAMIMLCYKTRAMGFRGLGEGQTSPADRLLGQLQEGLGMVLGALKNYSIAYEALGGMRDRIGSRVCKKYGGKRNV
ncbi:hypothetical protein BGZ60DRAFT_192792 [Tricladium varicosporioides]|nr:hypothetical protein BGZ60DRAFT_192792 [Hymenoscyphus varicosporioides]